MNDTQTDEVTQRSTDATTGLNTKRRRVLQSIGALSAISLSSGAAGTVGANEDSDDNGDSGDRGTGQERDIGIQFWTLRDLDEPVTDTIHRVADAGYDTAQPFTFGDENPRDIANAFDEAGIESAGMHVGLEELEDNFDETVDSLIEAGIETAVVPFSPEELWQTREGVEELANRMNTLADQLEERGLQFAYHNHDHEFVELDTRTAFECWVEKTNDNVLLEIDAGWVLAAGYNPTALAVRYADRTSAYHVKDMHVDQESGEPEFASIGEGDLNLESLIMTGVHVADSAHLIFENDEPGETDEEILDEMHKGYETISEIQNAVLGRTI